MNDEAWKELAWCRSVPTLPWIGDADRVTEPAEVAMAAVCAGCPVVFECCDYAACKGVDAGFWAGEWQDRRKPRIGDAA
jgi:hypothetical protein